MSTTSGDRFAGFNAWAYLDKDRPTTTWWVRFGKGQATGPFRSRGEALRNVKAEIRKMGHHGGYHVVGQLSGLGVAPSADLFTDVNARDEDVPFVLKGTTHATDEENLIITYGAFGKETAQIFKKVEGGKKRGRR